MAILPNMHSVSYISSGTMFQCEFRNDVCFVIRVTEKKKFLKILSRSRSKTRKLDNVKAKIQDKEVSQYIVKAKIQDKEVSQIQCHGQGPSFSRQYSSCSTTCISVR